MPSADQIIERLPSLYRPALDADPDRRARGADLFAQFIGAIGNLLDGLSEESSRVMQAHWLPYADAALLSEFERRVLQVLGRPPLKAGDAAIDEFPYLSDLPKIAALFDRAPITNPPLFRDRVEDFRERLKDVVALYREGLGTLRAVRLATRIGLPISDRAAAVGLRQRGFTVEEFAALRSITVAALARGTPTDMLGPLMRWRMQSTSIAPVAPTVFIQGVEPVSGVVDATQRPLIERLNPLDNTGIGLAYDGDLAPNQTLALSPSYASWLGMNDGIDRAESTGTVARAANVSASGPWLRPVAAPNGETVAFALAPDQFLYIAVNTATGGEVWRTDGNVYIRVQATLPVVHCVLVSGSSLLLGLETGITAIDLNDAFAPAQPDPAGLASASVNALVADRAGTVWAATSRGLAKIATDLSLTMVGLGGRAETETMLRCAFVDVDGAVLVGGDLGVFQFDPVANRWHYFQGGSVDEGAPDWRAIDPAVDALPSANTIFLPIVFSIRRPSDQALWLGTERGLARYVARENRRTFTTVLEAFPEITQATVRRIEEDERGQLWFATDTGLLMLDGDSIWQRQGGELTRLARVTKLESTLDQNVSELTQWRFARTSARWESWTPPSARGFAPFADPPIAEAEAAVRCIAWTDGVNPEIGQFDGVTFTVDSGAVIAPLRVRCKPSAIRITDGGIAALPRLAPGTSEWRYLALEPSAVELPRAFPAWTIEGRLLPEPSVGAAPLEGRYLAAAATELSEQAFAFNPAARVWLRWSPRERLSVLVRLRRERADEEVDGAVLDQVFAEVNRVRPAGVRVAIAVDEAILRN